MIFERKPKRMTAANLLPALAMLAVGAAGATVRRIPKLRRGNKYATGHAVPLPPQPIRPRTPRDKEAKALLVRAGNVKANDVRPGYRKLTTNLKKIRRQLRRKAATYESAMAAA